MDAKVLKIGKWIVAGVAAVAATVGGVYAAKKAGKLDFVKTKGEEIEDDETEAQVGAVS